MIAEVVINSFSRATDNIYHYTVPDFLEDTIKIGMRVIVPFGRGNKTQEAYIIGFVTHSEYASLKEVIALCDEYVYFGDRDVELVKFMVHRYFCSYISAIKTIIPSGLGSTFKKMVSLLDAISEENKNYIEHSVKAKEIYTLLLSGPLTLDELSCRISNSSLTPVLSTMRKRGIVKVEEYEHKGISDTLKKRVCLETDYEETTELINRYSSRAPARARCLEVLSDEKEMLLSELISVANTSKKTVDFLIEKGYISIHDEVIREDILNIDYETQSPNYVLTNEQKDVYNSVLDSMQKSEKNTFLLHGVTGSGKTEVYLNLMTKASQMGKKSILLVPEISLTPQMVSQVAARFGDKVAVIHSSLTQKQRYEQWKRIKENEVDVVVGARSAIFAPFDNVGLIIVDEEHENTYVSEFSPKYNAIEIAKFRARQFSCVLLLASATPLVESMFRAQSGRYKLLSMKERVNNAMLPTTEIIDMRLEMSDGNMSIFSRRLVEEIDKNLKHGEQTILFLNRRGFSSFVSCRNCGHTLRCPNCNVSLTYHKSINKMICHYCDYAHPVYNTCPECGSKHIRHFGIGTQKVAEEIKSIFPSVRITRMDSDTTSSRFSHEMLLESFKNHETDILIGTQMITKGLDFENVTLVGIVAADMSLNVDDYRAAERTFDLITQVAGRAGRGALKGRAIIQTYNPENETIIAAANQDYNTFYDEEIELRRLLLYPPFCEFINFVFTSEKEDISRRTAKEFRQALEKVTTSREAIFYPVGEAPLFKINGKYRYRFLVKTRYSKELYDKIAVLYQKISKKKASSQISIDVNPTNMY